MSGACRGGVKVPALKVELSADLTATLNNSSNGKSAKARCNGLAFIGFSLAPAPQSRAFTNIEGLLAAALISLLDSDEGWRRIPGKTFVHVFLVRDGLTDRPGLERKLHEFL